MFYILKDGSFLLKRDLQSASAAPHQTVDQHEHVVAVEVAASERASHLGRGRVGMTRLVVTKPVKRRNGQRQHFQVSGDVGSCSS